MSGWFNGSILPKKPLYPPNTNTPPPAVIPHPMTSDYPWLKWFEARDGWTEFDHDKELSKGWKYVGLDYSSVIGSDHAWCAMSLNSALIESGYKGNGSAAAVLFEHYGTPCAYVRGAIIPIRHASGDHHVTIFDHWVDESNKIAACRGGNQSNTINISHYNLSGNHGGYDECVSGPRWPVRV